MNANELKAFYKKYKSTLNGRDRQIANYFNSVVHENFIHVSKDWTEHDKISLLDCVIGITDGALTDKNIYDFDGPGYRGRNLGEIILQNLINIKEPRLLSLVSDIYIGQPLVNQFNESDKEKLTDIIADFFDFIRKTTGKPASEKSPALKYIYEIAEKLKIKGDINKKLRGYLKDSSKEAPAELELLKRAAKPMKPVGSAPAGIKPLAPSVSRLEKELETPAEIKELEIKIPQALKGESVSLTDYVKFLEVFKPQAIEVNDIEGLIVQSDGKGKGLTEHPEEKNCSGYARIAQLMNLIKNYERDSKREISGLKCEVDKERGIALISFSEKDSANNENKTYLLFSNEYYTVLLNPKEKIGGLKKAADILVKIGGKLEGPKLEARAETVVAVPAVHAGTDLRQAMLDETQNLKNINRGTVARPELKLRIGTVPLGSLPVEKPAAIETMDLAREAARAVEYEADTAPAPEDEKPKDIVQEKQVQAQETKKPKNLRDELLKELDKLGNK